MKKRPKLLVLWAVLVFTVLYLPILVMAVSSFNLSRYSHTWGGFTLDWYRSLLDNEEILSALWSSLWIGLASTLIASILGTMTALALRGDARKSGSGFSGSNLVESTLMVPVILPEIVVGISLLLLFVLVRIPLGRATVILAHVTFSIAYVFLVVRVRLKGLDPTLEEAARDLGADHFTTFFRVTLPLITPGVLAGALLAFTLSFEDFLITFFTAGVGTNTLPLQIYSMMKFGVSPVISALSTAFLLLTVGATLATQQWRSAGK
jgi:spermidine/putrescine transport system permease protein